MMQLRRLAVVGVVIPALIVAVAAITAAQGPHRGQATLDGYQEVLPGHQSGTIWTPAHGTFELMISPHGTQVDYTLAYQGFQTPVTQAHIHLGRPAVNGGIMVWLCGSTASPGPPGTPVCPVFSGTVTGTLTAADVVGPAGQGISAGEFHKFLDALRAEAGYVNVHSEARPPGEIRGQVTFRAHQLPAR